MEKEDKSVARIGRQVEHFNMVKQMSIYAEFSDDKVFRSLLSFEYYQGKENLLSLNEVDKTKTLSVILKNPSSADERKADNTINRVEKYVYKHFPDVLKVNILNMFAIRATDAIEVNSIWKEGGEVIGLENDETIANAVADSDFVIIAWGGRSNINRKIYDDRIEQVQKILIENIKDDALVYRVNSEKGSVQYPFHACFWSMDYNKEDITKVLKNES